MLPSELCERLRRIRSVGVITGAGMSAESGIQTYRGEGGLYDDPETGDRTVEALSGPTLLTDPDRTWRAVAGLARQAAGAKPNPGHEALAAIEHQVERFVLLTQNVDRLHQIAGSRNVIDIHGDVFGTRCSRCGRGGELTPDELMSLDRTPRCTTCDGALRPDAVLFEEMLPMDKIDRIRRELEADPPELVMLIGTTALFQHIAEPFVLACRRGRLTVEINPEATALSDLATYSLRGTAGTCLPAIERALRGPSD